jgi:hypothetical protein
LQVQDGDGGALAVWTETAAGSGNRLKLQAVKLTGNSCGKGQGGALSLDSQGLEMEDVKVSGNKVCCSCFTRGFMYVYQQQLQMLHLAACPPRVQLRQQR